MMGISGGEFVVLLVVVAIVLGPERLPQYAQQLARLVSRGYPKDALRVALLGGLGDRKALAVPERLEAVAHALEANGFRDVAIGQDEEHQAGFITFRSRRDGVERDRRERWYRLHFWRSDLGPLPQRRSWNGQRALQRNADQ